MSVTAVGVLKLEDVLRAILVTFGINSHDVHGGSRERVFAKLIDHLWVHLVLNFDEEDKFANMNIFNRGRK